MQNHKITDQNRNEAPKTEAPKTEAPKTEAEEHRDERIEKTGQLTLSDEASGKKIHLLSIIGEIEGHDNLWVIPRPQNTNTFCRSWQPSKTVRKSEAFWCC